MCLYARLCIVPIVEGMRGELNNRDYWKRRDLSRFLQTQIVHWVEESIIKKSFRKIEAKRKEEKIGGYEERQNIVSGDNNKR